MSASLEKLRCLNGTSLKFIAMLCMLVDHVGDLFFPGQLWLRCIGRISMPLFCLCVSEAYIHTRSKRSYLLRLGLFALVSELPFDLAFFGGPELQHQNMILSFFLAAAALLLYERISAAKPGGIGSFLGFGAVLAVAFLALLLRTDYSLWAVGTVFVFWLLREKPPALRALGGAALPVLTRTLSFYGWTGLCIPFLLLYNGKKGPGLKWLFYAFYPGHLLLLYLLKLHIS